jgi:Fe-S-cluster containining protein
MERGELFTHTALSQQSTRLTEVETFLFGIIDLLIQKGIVQPAELNTAVEKVRQELLITAETSLFRLRQDREVPFIPVNCDERMPLCKAVCCKLEFALSAAEVEAGQIKWDLGRPYIIRHEANGYCTHNNSQKRCCTIYENRPSVCKQYSCAGDQRIWKDFDKMELNHEWIDAWTVEKKPHLLEAHP